jgi:hypothetical protein
MTFPLERDIVKFGLLFQKIFSSRLLFQRFFRLLFQKIFCERGDPLLGRPLTRFSGVSETRKDENNLPLDHRI